MKDSLDLQRRYFDLGQSHFWLASHYDVVLSYARPLLEKLKRERGTLKILDAGCGPGNLVSRLVPWGQVVGTDASADALEFCAKAHGVEVQKCDVERMPFPDQTFDFVFASEVLEHIRDDLQALRELRRVLKPGGYLIATVPAFMVLWGRHDERYGHFRRYRRGQFCGVAREAGFDLVKSRYYKNIWFPPLLAMRRLKLAAGADGDDFHSVNRFLNGFFYWMIVTEARLGSPIPLPFGTSLVTILRRGANGVLTSEIDKCLF